MIEETVRVTRIEDSSIWIEAGRRSACASCSSRQSCSSGALTEAFSGKNVEMPVLNPGGLLPLVGQQVVIGLEEGSLIKASLMLYLLPLIALIVFAVVAQGMGFSEGYQIIAGGGGLIAGFMVARWFGRHHDSERCYSPVLLRCLS